MNERIAWPARTVEWVAQNGHALLIGLAVAALLVLVMLVLRSVGQRISTADPDCRTWRSVIGHVLARTSLLFMIFAALDTVAGYVQPPQVVARTIHVLFIIAAALQGAIWVRELALGAIGRAAGDDDPNGIGNARSVIRVLISVTVFAVALVVILANLGVNVTGLIAGLGIGGIAIGLAAQGIFSDLFAALSILFDKPFRRGDTIRYDNSTGTVERIGLKTTRLRSMSGEQLIMANTKLLEREIHNLALAKARRMTLHLAVASDTPAERLARVPAAAGEAVAGQNGCKLVRCVATGVGSAAVAFELVYDDKALDNNRNAENRSAILLNLLDRLAGEEIALVRASDVAPPLAPF
ncbi:MAG: mechanosensitive ion channel family protein [Bacillota bacterium]